MKKNKTKLLTILVIGTLLLGITGCGCAKKEKEKEEEKVVVNTNEEVIKDQTIETFELTNTSLVYTNGSSTLVTSVHNSSAETQYIKSFNIIVKDSEGNVMTTLLGYIGEEIPADTTRDITSNTDMDLSKAASVEYTINR